jgi:hypothetical protein
MEITDSGLRLVLTLVFATLGVMLAGRLSRLATTLGWIIFVIGILAVSGILARLIMLGIYSVQIETALYGFGLGILFGFVIHRQRSS